MKIFVFIVLAVSFLSFTYLYKTPTASDPASLEEARQKILSYKRQFVFTCSPKLDDIDFDDTSNAIPLL